MRTTITLTPEAEALVKKAMRERSLTFKEAVNSAIVDGLRPPFPAEERYETPTFDMGHARVSLDKASQLAGELEDEHFLAITASN